MEKNALKTAMKTSISEVLETMFFLPLEFSESITRDELLGSEKQDTFMSKVRFSGPMGGCFVLYVPGDAARAITSSFLGRADEDVSEEDIEGTVKEIINMIAGSTFYNYDDQAVFSLGIPEVVNPVELEINELHGEKAIFIAIEIPGNHLALEMVMGEPNST